MKHKGWIIIVLILVSLFIVHFIGSNYYPQYYYLDNRPECYLTEQDNRCMNGYWAKYDNSCWVDYNLIQCCNGKDYLLKGVYGDKTCSYIRNLNQR